MVINFKIKQLHSFLLIFAVIIPLLSCSLGVKGIKLTEDELFNIAQKQIKQDFSKTFKGLFREEKFLRTVKLMERLLEEYPESKYAKRAQLLIGDLYYKKGGKNLIDAEVEYAAFLKRFPLSDEASYAQYRLGMSLFRQFLDMKPKIKTLDEFDKIYNETEFYDKYKDKDLKLIKRAADVFADLAVLYPTCVYVDNSIEYLEIFSLLFSLQDLYIAKYYMKMDENIAAYRRLDNILIDCPETLNEDEIKYLLGICLWRLNFENESLKILNQLHTDAKDPKLKKKIAKTIDEFTKQT